MSFPGRGTGDRDLASLAARGDAAAFSHLIRDHSNLVYRVALRMLGADEAQDASQEAWVRAWRNIGNFRGDSAFTTWLYRIVVNTCLNIRRSRSRREAREMPEDYALIAESPTTETNPEAAALNQERSEEILDALQYLREEHRAALVLRHLEDLGYQEIAEILDVPAGTAKGWAHRGRAELLVAMSEKNKEDAGKSRKKGR